MDSVKRWLRGLPVRHGRTTLILLVAILAARLLPARLPGGRAAADARRRLPRLLRPRQVPLQEGSFGGPDFDDSSDWSPGAPLLYAASLLCHRRRPRRHRPDRRAAAAASAAILVAYLLGSGLNCRPAGLLAAFGVAVYPPFIHSTGVLISEPPAISPSPPRSSPSSGPTPDSTTRRLLRGLAAARAVCSASRRCSAPSTWSSASPSPSSPRSASAEARGWKPGLAGAALLVAALLLPIVPWAIRNQVVLDRTVPISTGGGKALYVGTFLPADGEYQRVKAILAKRYLGRELDPTRGRSRKSTRPRSSTASPRATPSCRATRRWARSARRTSPSTSTRTPSGTWR